MIGRHEHAGDAVVPENEHGGYLAGDALYRLGHTAIGVIAGPQHLTTTTDRLAGLRRAAREHGHRLPPRHIEYADFDRNGGAAAAAALLDRDPGADRDRRAERLDGGGRAGLPARTRHRRARRMSLIGFDDMPISVDVTPPLSTVRLPLEEIGVRAMSLALREPAARPARWWSTRRRSWCCAAAPLPRAEGAGLAGLAGLAGRRRRSVRA